MKSLDTIDFSKLGERANSDPQIARWGRGLNTRFLLEAGNDAYLIEIVDGKVDSVSPGPFVMPAWVFALRAPALEWQCFWQARPAPGHNDIFALIKRRVLKVEGNLQPFMSHLFFFKTLLASLRPSATSSDCGASES